MKDVTLLIKQGDRTYLGELNWYRYDFPIKHLPFFLETLSHEDLVHCIYNWQERERALRELRQARTPVSVRAYLYTYRKKRKLGFL